MLRKKKKIKFTLQKTCIHFQRSDLACKCKSAGKKVDVNLTLQLQYII